MRPLFHIFSMEPDEFLSFAVQDDSGQFCAIIKIRERGRPRVSVTVHPTSDAHTTSSTHNRCPLELDTYLRRKLSASLLRGRARSGVSSKLSLVEDMQREAANAVEIYSARYPRWWAHTGALETASAARSATATRSVLVDSERVLQSDALAAVASCSVVSLLAGPADMPPASLAERVARVCIGVDELAASAFLVGSPGRASAAGDATGDVAAGRREPDAPGDVEDEASLHPSVAAWRRRRKGTGTSAGAAPFEPLADSAGADSPTAPGLCYARGLGAFGTDGHRVGGASAGAGKSMASPLSSTFSPPPTPPGNREAARRAGGAVTRELLAGRLIRRGYAEYISCSGSAEQRRLRVALVAAAMEHPQWHSPSSLAGNTWFQGPFYSGSPPAVLPPPDDDELHAEP